MQRIVIIIIKKKHFKLQSDVPIDLLDVEKNSAVVSYSQCDPEVSGEKIFSQIKPVACRWAGDVLQKVIRAFGQEQ